MNEDEVTPDTPDAADLGPQTQTTTTAASNPVSTATYFLVVVTQTQGVAVIES